MAKSKAELMAEKMKKERVGASAFDAGRKPVIEETVVQTANVPVVEEPVVEKKPEVKGEEKVEEKASQLDKNNLLAGLKKQKKVEKKTFSYYLTIANDEKLKKIAKAQKISTSEVLDFIIGSLDV